MLEVKFWPNKDTSHGVLGGGYIVTDIFKFSYKVRQGQYGPWVILPNVKKADGSGYTNLVDFVNKDAKDKSKKAPAPAETAPDISDLGHIQEAITSLLDNIANMVTMKCGNLSSVESLCVAACLAMNNMMTIKELVASDLPITAQILDIVPDSSNLLSAALNIDKTYFNKLSTNQAAFIESLKRWVYEKLNRLDTNQIRAFLTASYGTASPDVSTKLIQVKDCGTAYGNLLFTAKIMFNK